MYKLSPSKAHRFLLCTKSLLFDVEFKETPASIRGTIMHNLAQMKLTLPQDEISSNFIDLYIEKNKINDYELNNIDKYCELIKTQHAFYGGKITVEQKRTLSFWGFNINFIVDADIVTYRSVHINDLKSGRGYVSEVDNEQLMFYALYFAIKYPNINEYYLSIYQNFSLRTQTLTRDDILDFFVAHYETFENIKNNNLSYNAGEKQCQFCNNKKTCVAYAEYVLRCEYENEI